MVKAVDEVDVIFHQSAISAMLGHTISKSSMSGAKMLPMAWRVIHSGCFALEYLATLTARMQ